MLSCLGALACVRPANKPVFLTGVYTSMEFHPLSGDTVGAELIVVYSTEGYFALFQVSEGYPARPVLVRPRIVEKDGTIEFTVPEGVPWAGTFRGTITGEAIDITSGPGVLSPREESFWHLPRGKSWWDWT